MSVFRILAEELENWYNNQPIVSLVNETEGKKLYYHGRNSFRPYSGKYIFITDDLGYASGYGDGKILYSYSLPFGEDRLFSIKNPNHLALLEKYIDPYTISMIFNSSGQNQEIDWAALSYISTDEFEEPEDLFKHLGFYGIKLKERTGINSLYIFDQDDLTFEGTIDLTTPEMQDKIRQFYQNFTKDKNFLQEDELLNERNDMPKIMAANKIVHDIKQKVDNKEFSQITPKSQSFLNMNMVVITYEYMGIKLEVNFTDKKNEKMGAGYGYLEDKNPMITVYNCLVEINGNSVENVIYRERALYHEVIHFIDDMIDKHKFSSYDNDTMNLNDPEKSKIYYNSPEEINAITLQIFKAYMQEMGSWKNIPDDFKSVRDGIFVSYRPQYGGKDPKVFYNKLTPDNQKKFLNRIYAFYQSLQEFKKKKFEQEKQKTQPVNETTYKVYHGTNEKFGKFNFNKSTQGIVWFTDSIDSIQKGEHGGQGNKYIMTRYITINNPAGWEEYEKYGLQQLQDMGYDGVILPQGDKTDYFVFSNKNISAKEPVNLTEEDDYRGYHTAPTSEDSPMYDVTNTFGEDMYTDRALRMFGGYGQYDGYSIALIQRARNKPNMPVKIYRAIPAILTNQEKINDYEKQKAYILKTGKLPKDVDNWRNSSEYYDWISNEIDRLKALPPEQDAKAKINNGDWVTINPAYAKVHGQSNLNNKFKVLSKTVPAKNLFTDGNSIHEWGYVGNDLNEEINDNNITITPKDIKLVGNIKTNGYESIIEAYVYPNQSRTPIKYEFLSSIMLDKYSYKINGIFNQQPKSFNDKDLIKIDVVLDYENVENYIANRNNISTAIKNQFKKQLADKLNQSSQTIDERKKKRQLGMALPLGQIYSAGFASEGVADKYAEREFNIPDTGVDADYQATRMIQPDLSMGEYIGDLKQDGKFLTRVFKNPKNLNKFDKNSRAVSDKYGNLFVAEKDVPFYHSELQKFLEKYGNVNEFMQWYRYGTNIFTLSGSYSDLYKINDRELEQEYYDNVKKRNPQYKFLFTMRNPDVTNEGIADDARERMFNIPNPEAEMDYQATRYIEPTLDMGEHVGDIITGGEFQSRIFKNPKSLDKFGNRFSRTVKAISLENGDLYVAEKDGYFYHGDILSILKLRGNHFMGWYANKHNNTFSLAMSSFDEKLVNHIKEMRDIVQKKFPQYKFHALNSNENK